MSDSEDRSDETPSGDDGAGAEAALEQEGEATATAEPELSGVAEERDRLKEQLLRTAADLDNFRKRARREAEDAERRGREDALREVLPVVDNLERAVAAADQSGDATSILDGVRMVLKLFEDTASRMELTRIPAVGERFDPTVHEAVQQEESDEHAAGTIVRELLPGYRLGQRLLRAAMVVVARPKARPSTEAPEGEA